MKQIKILCFFTLFFISLSKLSFSEPFVVLEYRGNSDRGNLSSDNLVAASDAFFPFRDSIDAIGKSGIKLFIQPGGSIKDNEVIDACNEYNISMVFTKTRCFKH